MGVIDAKMRKAEPKGDFGLPGQRKYPMPNKNHARVAKSYASKEANAGKLSAGQKAEIDAKANKVLGGKVKA